MTKEQFLVITEWQDKTFPNASSLTAATHLEEEIRELRDVLCGADGNVEEEYADCFLLLFGSAHKHGFSYSQICEMIDRKMKVNMERQWGNPNDKGYIKHIEP